MENQNQQKRPAAQTTHQRFGPRRPMRRFNPTRSMNPGQNTTINSTNTSSAPASTVPTSISSTISPTISPTETNNQYNSNTQGNRVVFGRGAPKSFHRPSSSPMQSGAGRMNIVRKELTKNSRRGPSRPSRPTMTKDTNGDVIPPLAADSIRIIPLGGVEEIGRNMTLIEYGDDILVIDIGFQFKDDDTPGIDFILPNTKYLEERKSKIRAVLITHGHLDHIGGIPYIMPRIGNPPLYTRLLTSVLIQKRQEEFPQVPKIDLKVVEKNETITLGKLRVKFFSVTHTIPDAMGVIIETPYGSIVHTGDLKLDHVDGVPTQEEEAEYDRAFKNEKVLMLMADSTNVENPGFSLAEKVVHNNLEKIVRDMQGRLIIATFSSLLERLLKIVEFAEKYGKKVIVEGRSLKQNIEICKHLGLLKAKKDTIISVDEMENFPPDRIVILSTGAQANDFSALVRMSQKTHAKIKITPRDTIVLSSSVVPGNERAVQKLKDNLSRQGARILHYRIADVHSSGHANRDETAWIHKKIHPKFFMPLHGYHYMLRAHCDIAKESNGLAESDVVIPDNSSIIEIQNGGANITRLKEKAPSGLILVDGFSVGDVQDVVIRDRQMLAQDGIFIIFGLVNHVTGKLRKSPDIISRGFVYLRESQELLHEVRILIKDTIEKSAQGMNPINIDFIKDNISDAVSKYLLQKTAKRPMVIPVILTV